MSDHDRAVKVLDELAAPADDDGFVAKPHMLRALIEVARAALAVQSAPGPNQELDALDRLAAALSRLGGENG